VPSLALVALVAAIGILVLIPTRRLFVAGWPPRSLALYFVGVVALGVIVAELRAPARFLIPILVVAYIAPFVTARDGIRRLLGGRPRPDPVVRRIERPAIPAPPEVIPPADAAASAARPVTPAEPDQGAGEDDTTATR